jgi:DNA polymerase III subunit delta'
MSFADIVGHQKQLATLRAALASGRLHHAYLFLGPEGVGKHTIAVAVAKAIHCQANADDFCGQCVNCARITDGNHPDVRALAPLADKKEISIQQIREIERELNYRSFTGKRKIVIIDPAILLNAAAQNALLKTLEEPPRESLIILIAPNAGGLLPTLRSRCLRLSFAPLSRPEVVAYLQKQHRKSAEEAAFLAAMSMGSIGVALALDKDALTEKRRTWIDGLGALKSGDFQSAMTAAEALAGNREEALRFIKWAESWYRDLLIYGMTSQADDLVNSDMRAQVEQQAAQMSVDGICAAMANAVDAGVGVQRNLNRRMLLEKFLFGVVGERR